MKTEVAIDGGKFLINGKLTYEGVSYCGRPIQGLLFNSRMIQGVFDDECPQTVSRWNYPDTGKWDADRNTDEFCQHLPEYRSHGLLGVTVGLQGGGSIYTPDVYDHYINTAYAPDGSFKQPYFDRLTRVIQAADEIGMVVIVNAFYWKQARTIEDDKIVFDICERLADWLLKTGYRNIMIDVANESGGFWKRPVFEPENIHKLIAAMQAVTVDGRRLLVSSSAGGGDHISSGKWQEIEDFTLPHGNGCTPERLATKLQRFKESDGYVKRPRPLLVNEDSVALPNLEAAVQQGASWGFYCQGYGSGYKDRWMNWREKTREEKFEDLSGYQTLPVNWGINTPIKRAFFDRIKTVTCGK